MIRKQHITIIAVFMVLLQVVMLPVTGDPAVGRASVTFEKSPVVVSTIGDKITFSGTNTVSKTTYLSVFTADSISFQDQLTGIPGTNASDCQMVDVGPDDTWSWTWDTHGISHPGQYSISAYSSPDIFHQQITGDYATVEGYLQAPENFVAPPPTNFQIDARLLVDYTMEAGICGPDTENGSVVVVEWETDKGTGTNRGCLAGTEISSPQFIRIHAYERHGNYPIKVSIVSDPLTNAARTVLSASEPDGKKPIDLYLDLSQPVTTDNPVSRPAGSRFSGVTITPSPARKGDTVVINGTVEGSPVPAIALWIFGNQGGDIPLYARRMVASPDEKGRFSYELDGSTTATMPGGILYVVAQDPGRDNAFDIVLEGDKVMNLKRSDYYDPSLCLQVTTVNWTDDHVGPNPLRGSFAEDATVTLVNQINDVNVDDSAFQTSFVLNGTAPPDSGGDHAGVTGPVPSAGQPDNVTAVGTRVTHDSSPGPTPRASPAGIEGILLSLGLAGFELRRRR